MTKFGWSLPPGCTQRMLDRQFEDGPCDVCGYFVDDCVCPTCPVCQTHGDPFCYEDEWFRQWAAECFPEAGHNPHGLTLNIEQRIGQLRMDITNLKDMIRDMEDFLTSLENLNMRKE